MRAGGCALETLQAPYAGTPHKKVDAQRGVQLRGPRRRGGRDEERTTNCKNHNDSIQRTRRTALRARMHSVNRPG